MKYLLSLCCLIATATSLPAYAVESEEFLLNTYVKEQAVKTLEAVLPKGEFLVQTSVSLKPAAKDESVSLPFGGTVIHLSDLQDSKNLPLNDLLQRIQNIKIQVSMGKDVSDGVKSTIKSALVSSLYLDPKRGDKIEFQLLPEGWHAVWHPVVPAAEVVAKEKPDYTLPFTLAGIGVFIALVLFACFQRLQTSVSKAMREASAALASESGAQIAPLARGNDSRETNLNKPALAASGTTENSLGKMDLGVLKAFVTDSFFVDQYRSISSELLNGMLPYELSCSLEDALSPYFLEETDSPKIGENEIKQILFKHLSEYRKFSKSPLFGALGQIEPSGLIRGFKQLTTVERLLTLQHVGPLFRERLLETLTPKDRLQLFNEVGTATTGLDGEKTLSAINAKLANFYRPPVSSTKQAFSKLSRTMLHPFSFEEDQAFYGESKVTKSFNYSSVLEAFEVFDSSVWSTLDLHIVSLAYAGYSASVQEQLFTCFDGKRREWLKSLFAKMSNQEKILFASFECANARIKLIKLIADKKTEQAKSGAKLAAA